MRFQPKYLLLLALLAAGSVLFLAGCEGSAKGGIDRGNQVDIFAESILPILEQDCSGTSCHSPGAGGAVAFAVFPSSSQTYQSVRNLVVPGNASGSSFINSMGADYAPKSHWDAVRLWINDGAEQFGEPGSGPPPPEPVAYVGMDVCANFCHIRQTEKWLTSPHGNYESWDGSNEVRYNAEMNNTGYPTVAMISALNCAFRCHDNLGDGRNNLILGFTGNRQRPVIGCEECHGAGGEHFNAPGTKIAYTMPAAEQCGKCHNATTSDYAGHDTRNPDGKNVKEDYLGGTHALSLESHIFASVSDGAGGTVPSTTDVRASCSRCHTDEGSRLYGWVNPTYTDVYANIPSSEPAVKNASRVECRTCHIIHDEGKLIRAATVSGSTEYNTCTFCHAPANFYHGEKSSYSWTKKRTADGNDYYTFDGERIIYDTHGSDDPATATKIEGYVLKPKDERACKDCHNVHSVKTIINKEWAESAHGGHLLIAKEIAADTEVAVATGTSIGSAGITPPVIAANAVGIGTGAEDEVIATWAHYDWDHTHKVTSGALADDRAQCQRCHTATGVKNFLTSPTTYSPYDNDFSHLSGWAPAVASPATATVASGQNELLYCWGCHKDSMGGLRNPGALAIPTAEYTVAGQGVVIPDVGKSNVCVGCHGARGNMDKLVAAAKTVGGSVDPAAAVAGKPAATQTHYLTAAATMFQQNTKIGYQYGGDYSDGPTFGHRYIEVGQTTSGDGPCATCHMYLGNHSLEAVDHDEEGAIDLITAQTRCNTSACHAGARTPASLEALKVGYEDALEALKAALIAKNITPIESYPYFSLTGWVNLGNYGAGHNYSYLKHEPGAYVHNSLYARRLIFDSIDWLDNGVMDATINLTGFASAAGWISPGYTDITAIARPEPEPEAPR